MAQAGDQIAGFGQVKILSDGTPELASLAVLPEYQNSGIGSCIVWTLIDRTPGPLYLRCAGHNEGYYQRFGFRTGTGADVPRSLRRTYTAINAVLPPMNLVLGSHERLCIMERR